MYTAKTIEARIILRFAWRSVLFFIVYSIAVVALHQFLNLRFLSIPFVPISIVGIAVSFYLSFKNNSSYERLWEARRVWGGITNFSRTFAVFVLDYVQPNENLNQDELHKIKRQIILRHIAYLNALRIQLRRRSVWENDDRTAIDVVQNLTTFRQCGLTEELQYYLGDDQEAKFFSEKFNPATHILRRQSEELEKLHQRGALSDYKQVEINRLIGEFYNSQGACERIKSFPFPRQYAYFSKVFAWIFILLLPLGLVNQFHELGANLVWLAVPFSILISWIFNTMEVTGDTSENPFENAINDVPMTAICRNIEIDLRQLLGENDELKPIQPENNILM